MSRFRRKSNFDMMGGMPPMMPPMREPSRSRARSDESGALGELACYVIVLVAGAIVLFLVSGGG
jgi:hypothetical protein